MIAFTTAETITFSVVGFFVLIAVLVFARLLVRRTPPTWRRYRVGFFVEREPTDRELQREREEAWTEEKRA